MSIIDRLLNKKSSGTSGPHELSAAARRAKVANSGTAHEAAELLRAPNALSQLGEAEALTVVSFMEPKIFRRGDTLIAEGEKQDTGYMLLVLKGEVTVETLTVSRQAKRTMTVLGPGSLIGEISLLDGAARSASCIAATTVTCAALSRQALEAMIESEPRAAAKMMTAVSHVLAERLRDSGEKLRLYAELVRTMQGEIDKALPG